MSSAKKIGFGARICKYQKSQQVKNLNNNLRANTGRYLCITNRNIEKEKRDTAVRRRVRGFNEAKHVRRDVEYPEIVYNRNIPEALKLHVNDYGYVDVSRAVIAGLLPATMNIDTKKGFDDLMCLEPDIENTEGQDSSQLNIAITEGEADSENNGNSNQSKRRHETDTNDHRATKVIEQMANRWEQEKEEETQLERSKELMEVRILNLNWDDVVLFIDKPKNVT